MTQINQLCTQAGYQHTKVHIPRKDRSELRASRPHAQAVLLLYRNRSDKHFYRQMCRGVMVTYIPCQSAPGTYQHNCGTYI